MTSSLQLLADLFGFAGTRVHGTAATGLQRRGKQIFPGERLACVSPNGCLPQYV